MATIGKRIKARREELGMTQEELAKKLGYKSKTTIAKIELGVNDIVQSKVVEFAKALNTTISYLMGWEDEELMLMDGRYNKKVGTRLFSARKHLKMTRAELGLKIGLHESTIKRYEDGEIKSLDIKKIKEFAKALEVSPAYLMGWEEEKPYNDGMFDAKLLKKFHKLNDGNKKAVISLMDNLLAAQGEPNVY
jgi:transcriptional regulator with XRE-family HTH domain